MPAESWLWCVRPLSEEHGLKTVPRHHREESMEFVQVFEWSPRRTLTIPTVTSSLDRIDGVRPQTLADEEIVKQTTDDYVLGDGIVRKLAPCDIANLSHIIDHSTSSSLLWFSLP